MNLREQHIDLIKKVAEALGDFNDQVVYVGGAAGRLADLVAALLTVVTRVDQVDQIFPIWSQAVRNMKRIMKDSGGAGSPDGLSQSH